MKKRIVYILAVLFFTVFVLYNIYPLIVAQPNDPQPMHKGDHVFFNRGTEVRASDIAGRGLFATRFFRKGEIVERSPILVYKRPDDYVDVDVDDYTMTIHDLDDTDTGLAIGGYFSFGNHSENNNVEMDTNGKERYVDLVAVRDIFPGEEILNHYGDSYWESRDDYQKK